MSRWTVTQGKAKFSGVLEKAKQAPQAVTKHGRPAVYIVSAEEWERKTRRNGTVVEFFRNSPLCGSGVKIARIEDLPRDIDL
jgi:prevent-host-death family protein